MMKKDNRICYVCQKKYTFCGSCAQYKELPAWHAMFCGENCKDIWNVLSTFESGEYSPEQAKEIMSKLDTSKKDSYIGCVKKSYNKLYGIEKPEVEEPEAEVVYEPSKQEEEPVKESAEKKKEKKPQVVKDKNYGGKVVFDSEKAKVFNKATQYSKNK